MRDYRRTLPAAHGATIRLHCHCNVSVDADLQAESVSKPLPPAFGDFAAYHRFLTDSLEAICANAGDAGRRKRYTDLLATLSTGYD